MSSTWILRDCDLLRPLPPRFLQRDLMSCYFCILGGSGSECVRRSVVVDVVDAVAVAAVVDRHTITHSKQSMQTFSAHYYRLHIHHFQLQIRDRSAHAQALALVLYVAIVAGTRRYSKRARVLEGPRGAR